MRLVAGVGVNDCGYIVNKVINGKQQMCPYYNTWKHMLDRCYRTKPHKRNPTYIGCTVAEEWKIFSNFRKWMEAQDWVGKHLDKDIIVAGNRHYSESTCVFVDPQVNTFLCDSRATRGKYMIGVHWHKRVGKFMSQCMDASGKKLHLGYFDNELSAHLAWKSCKHKLACVLAEKQENREVAEALLKRFL